MESLETTYPNLHPEAVLAKAHAQLLLEVQQKEVGWSHSAWENDFSSQNRQIFLEAHRDYLVRYRRLFNLNAATRKERAGFLHFCGTHKLTCEGRLYYFLFRAKELFSGRGFIGKAPR